MDLFQVISKHWPSGTVLDLGIDLQNASTGFTPTRTAPPFMLSPDGQTTYDFLFWDTGRHATTKRSVHWTFSVFGWGMWTATRWYGDHATGGGGLPRVTVDAFSLSQDLPIINETPIDPAASTFPAGGYPFAGNDRQIDTTNGATAIVAKDPFTSLGFSFAGWLSLTSGGDPSGVYEENDAGASGPPGGVGFYQQVVGPFTVGQGGGANLIGTFFQPPSSGPIIIIPPDIDQHIDPKLLEPIFGKKKKDEFVNPLFDPSPIDHLRLGAIRDLLTRAEIPSETAALGVEKLLTQAKDLSDEALVRGIQELKTGVELNGVAIDALNAELGSRNR
jgi:hypothetical protein